jgi:NTE family protein
MIAQGDFEKCCELWEDVKYSMVIDANDDEIVRLKNLKLDKEDLILLAEKLKSIISDRGFDITPFKNLLNTYIDEEKLRNSNIDFGLVTVDLTNFKPVEIFIEDIPEGELKTYILASAYIPTFKKEKFGGIRYLDGAFYDNLPFKLLKSKGYNDLIIVRTHARGFTRRISSYNLNTIIISPSDDIGKTYDVDKDKAKSNIQLGYFDGLKAIRGLKGFKYYIDSDKDEDYFLERLFSISDDQIKQIRLHIKTPKLPDRRVFFEYIIPKLASVMGLKKDFTYEDFIIGFLEKRAEASHIERFKIYKYDELLDLIKCNPVIREEEHDSTTLEKIIEKVDISNIFNKEDLILKIAGIILCNE